MLLRRLRQPTFFTRDLGFYTPELRHQHYAIVVAADDKKRMCDALCVKWHRVVAIPETARDVRGLGSTRLAARGRNGRFGKVGTGFEFPPFQALVSQCFTGSVRSVPFVPSSFVP